MPIQVKLGHGHHRLVNWRMWAQLGVISACAWIYFNVLVTIKAKRFRKKNWSARLSPVRSPIQLLNAVVGDSVADPGGRGRRPPPIGIIFFSDRICCCTVMAKRTLAARSPTLSIPEMFWGLFPVCWTVQPQKVVRFCPFRFPLPIEKFRICHYGA